MLIGYARVSTGEQTLDLQTDALHTAGCERLFTDTISGATSERPGLSEVLDFIRPGDTLVVWRLDRLGRSLRHLIETITDLEKKGIGFRSLNEAIDTTSTGGKLIFHIFGALAEFERDLIRDRTRAGLEAAWARGRKGGRPYAPAYRDKNRLALAQRLYDEKQTPVDTICQMLKVSRATFYRDVKEMARETPAAATGSVDAWRAPIFDLPGQCRCGTEPGSPGRQRCGEKVRSSAGGVAAAAEGGAS
jgi:DNA invertase Pin-like site-specific DNA recombinase